MKDLPLRIYRAAQVRELDRLAIEHHEIPGYTLMYRAGEAALSLLRKRWPWARRILVLCGAGNNAGDGYVLARLAQAERLHVTVIALFDPAKLSGDAKIAWDTFHSAGGQVVEWDPRQLDNAEIIVDAILGTGLTRPINGRSMDIVRAVNASGRPVLAIDIPTGLCADTGTPLGAAIKADVTITFVGLKLGLYTGAGQEYAGEVHFDDLGVSALLGDSQPCAGRRIDRSLIRALLPRRPRTAHKGDHGHVLCIGGGPSMPGAIRLTAEAALHAGAGLVTVATHPFNVSTVMAGRPELMCAGVRSPDELAPLLRRCNTIALGPGLGRDEWARSLVEAALAADRPLVVDADALNLLAVRPQRRERWILTPHPGEAARLLGTDVPSVQHDRFGAVAKLLERYGGVVVLKGAGTLVGQIGDVPCVCDRGNPGMAAGGMGDLLTGIVAGIVAQTGRLFDSACAGVLVHALAGDDAARGGERGMLASDLLAHVRKWVNLH
jgi:ADP-dependent NAD(P)H-hydrate dehydratase / NAD(P)H-hydrate epimerase